MEIVFPGMVQLLMKLGSGEKQKYWWLTLLNFIYKRKKKILNVKSWSWSAELWRPLLSECDWGGSQTHTASLCLCLLPSTLSSGSPYDSEKVSGIKAGTGSLPVVPQSSGVNFGSCWGLEGLESVHACTHVLMDLISASRQRGHRNEVNNKQSCTHGILIGVIFGWEMY